MPKLLFAILTCLAATHSLAGPPPGQGAYVPNFPCSSFAECAKCEKTVEGVVSVDSRKNRMAFLGKCQAECKELCEPDPAEGDPNEEL